MSSDRRHLTILNCDIVNSTFYADRMDPEDFESLLTIFYETCKPVVESRRGVFAHHTGDGFTAYFGSSANLGPGRPGGDHLRARPHRSARSLQLSRRRQGSGAHRDRHRPRGRQHGQPAEQRFGVVCRRRAPSSRRAHPGHLAAGQGQRRRHLLSPGGAQLHLHRLRQSHAQGLCRTDPCLAGGHAAREVEFRFDERQERLSPFVGRTREMAALDHCRRLAAQGRDRPC